MPDSFGIRTEINHSSLQYKLMCDSPDLITRIMKKSSIHINPPLLLLHGTPFELKTKKEIMTQDIIYTDGHGVRVTPNQFIVGKTEYLLRGVTNIRLYTIKANLVPAVLLIIFGIASAIAGFMRIFRESDQLISTDTTATSLGNNEIAMLVGGILFLAGVIWALVTHEKYAVRLTTAEGEKDALISTKKDYVGQIINAVQHALGFRVQNNSIL
jgi:hypothetical protein